ncbi:hypothetical protein BDP81DRAFT_11615 [Colletotrichum phormii]|uniref:Uncharacterized protein n=1 Tax=Colletotrichum phormii TaxID=359342 RepID=A0AAJ0A3M7_9PEZI|nr:uncharacterized protein BDP81DRAFT_11615 [Colletotrichum phormii]KAK1655872.1 hypothetical protein BDP81DRAFT_11615 [Colletotrichum phormii]
MGSGIATSATDTDEAFSHGIEGPPLSATRVHTVGVHHGVSPAVGAVRMNLSLDSAHHVDILQHSLLWPVSLLRTLPPGDRFRPHLSLLAGSPYTCPPDSFSRDSFVHISLGGPRHHPMDVPWTQPITPQFLLNQYTEWPTEGTLTYLGIGVIARPIFCSFFFFL